MERFRSVPDKLSRADILKASEHTAYIFTLSATEIELKDPREPMPYLQFSKCAYVRGADMDNGRIMSADYVEITLTDVDLRIIDKQYKMSGHVCSDVWIAAKKPLPRWFRDLVYKCFAEKCQLKGGDPVAYALAKARLNSLYGMCCQKSIKPEIIENYETGEYSIKEMDGPEAYQKYLDNQNTILSYAWGVYVTAYATAALYELSDCINYKSGGEWLYSDTDSIYAFGWDEAKLKTYNDKQIGRLRKAGYGSVKVGEHEFNTGVAELDGIYTEFIALHSKCYAVRKKDGSIKITVAGVPKKGGAKCLKDDLSNFRDGFTFRGVETGKLTHYYIYRDGVYIDDKGIEYGNSIDLHACDYIIGEPNLIDIEKVLATDINNLDIKGYYDNE